jgi:hypothetical protein
MRTVFAPRRRSLHAASRRRLRVIGPERLESRLALAATTTPAGLTIDNSLTAVVTNSALGGIQAASITGFYDPAGGAPGYLLLTQPGQQAPYGIVSYAAVTAGSNPAFTTLALPAGDGNVAFRENTTIAQAAQSTTSSSQFTYGDVFTGTKTSVAVAAGAAFQGTGFICILGSSSIGMGGGGNGIFSYDVTKSTLPTATQAGTFVGLAAVGVSGIGTNQPFDQIKVPQGSIVIESSAPTPGSTIMRTASITLPPKPGTKFNLPVLSTGYGFATASPQQPGSLVVELAGGGTTIVQYTGMSKGGRSFLGCTTTVTGTVPMNAAVTATANSPVTFTFTNNSKQGLAVYVAIAGQLSDAAGNLTYGYLTPQQTAGKQDLSKPLQFTPMTGSPPASVPTFMLFPATAAAGATKSFKVTNSPDARMVATRVVFGMGLPPVVPINSNKPAFPAMSNPSDPNNTVNFDFLEFTMRNSGPNDGTLFVNTTQVDQVGLPFTMNVSPADTSGAANGVGVKIGRALLAQNYSDFIKTQFTAGNGAPIDADAEAAFEGLLTPYRLLNPSDAFTNPPALFPKNGVATLDSYFDPALAKFFQNYSGGGFRLQRDGYRFVGTTVPAYQPAAYTYEGVTLGGVSGTTATLSFPAVAKPGGGTAAAPVSLGTSLLVSGPGITGTAVVTAVPAVEKVSKVTTVSIAGNVTAGSGSYTFTVPGEFTVLKLQQADANWNAIPGGQTYQVYAPFFAESRPLGKVPTGLPMGSGIGSLKLAAAGSGYGVNTVGTLTFTGGGGSNATGFYVTDASGAIVSLGLTSPGSGYTSMPQVGFSGGGANASVTASALPAAPPWTGTQSAGLMTFGCLGVFADGIGQANAGQVTGTGSAASILLDIENTIVSAFNRGVANSVAAGSDVTTPWQTASTFYPQPAADGTNRANYYSAFLHKPHVSVTRPGSQVGLAYGFAYDDQGNNSTTLTSVFPQQVSVTFNQWQNKRFAPTPLVFTQQPVVSGGNVSFKLQGLAGKQYRYQLYQVAAAGQWTPVGTPVTVTAGRQGVVSPSTGPLAAPPADKYVLVVWAADTIANGGPAVPFGGQYSASKQFTVKTSTTRLAAPQRLTPLSVKLPLASRA